MKGSSMIRVENDTLVIIRASYCVAFGSPCAAALVNLYSYWHDINIAKLEQQKEFNKVARQHGESIKRGFGLLQGHSQQKLIEQMQGLFTKHEILAANKRLVEIGVISMHRNPNKNMQFDRTNYFLFHPKKANSLLSKSHIGTMDCPNTDNGETEHGQWRNPIRTNNNKEYSIEENIENIESLPEPEKIEKDVSIKDATLPQTNDKAAAASFKKQTNYRLIETEEELADIAEQVIVEYEASLKKDYEAVGFIAKNARQYALKFANQFFKQEGIKMCSLDNSAIKKKLTGWSFIFSNVNLEIAQAQKAMNMTLPHQYKNLATLTSSKKNDNLLSLIGRK